MKKTNSLIGSLKKTPSIRKHKKTLSETSLRSTKPRISPSAKKRHTRINSESTLRNLDTQESVRSKQSFQDFFRKKLKQKPRKNEFPMSGAQALKAFKSKLSPFEQSEILYYKDIYFVGQCKKPTQFEDDKGNYKATKGDHVAYRYELKKTLGAGSFGLVMLAVDHKTHAKVALKIVKNKKKLSKQAKIEIKILNMLSKKDCIVQLFDSFTFRNHICMTFEVLDINLYDCLKMYNFRGFKEIYIKKVANQMLKALVTLDKLNVIHCDIKPENILLTSPKGLTVKLIDFGSSCLKNQQVYSYIQSRYYRAPEVSLQIPYTKAIDIWSLGCVLVEIYTGKPLFKGYSEVDQFYSIVEVLGLPPPELVAKGKRSCIYFDQTGELRPYRNAKGVLRTVLGSDLRAVLEGTSEQFVSFIARCLDWIPENRLTPTSALNHEWFKRHRRAVTQI